MNRLVVVPHEEVSEGLFVVRDPNRIEHVLTVLRAQKGDTIKLCLLNRGLGNARIEDLSSERLCLKLESFTEGELPWCHLHIALSRPPTMRKILEHGSCMGVGHFSFFRAKLSQKSYAQSKSLYSDELSRSLRLGLAQSGCYFCEPQVEILNGYFDAGEVEGQKFLLSKKGSSNFGEVKLKTSERIDLLVGPERGWTDAEEERFIQQGYRPIKISKAILRVEIAVFSALAQLELQRMK